MTHTLPDLPYAFDALEPHIDAKTMEIHHGKHHQAYVNKLNAALEKYPDLAEKPLEELLRNLDLVPEDIRSAVKNNGGGHYNHSLYWRIMAKDAKPATGKLKEDIESKWETLDAFKEEFSKKARKLAFTNNHPPNVASITKNVYHKIISSKEIR